MAADVKGWQEARFGLFIHWGLYAQLGRGEWVMYNESIDPDTYAKLADTFVAERFDAKAWARAAKMAGMKYMVLTTRHHDGFSLWDSEASWGDFTSMKTAARRDFVREYADACRAEGLKVGFYYSPLDWRMPGFFFPGLYKKNAEEMREQCFGQIRELLTNYGKIDVLWFDGGEDDWLGLGRNLTRNPGDPAFKMGDQYAGFWHSEEMEQMIRELQPEIVVNNRFGDQVYGNFGTPEGKPGDFNRDKPWESCMTLSGAWGWYPTFPRSLREVTTLLLKNATGDGNFLLNVGPRADGSIEPAQLERLMEIGQWLAKYGESVYGTRGGPFHNSDWGGMTCKGKNIYLHIWDWRLNEITLPKIDAEIVSVSSLTAAQFNYSIQDGRLTVSVGANDRLALDTIIKIELDRDAEEITDTSVTWCDPYVERIRGEAVTVDWL